MQEKAALRAAALSRRAALPPAAREAAGASIAAALQGLLSGARVAAYAAIGSEPPIVAALAGCHRVLLPVLLPDGDLDWSAGPDVERTTRGLLEPTGPRLGREAIGDCDVILVPALAVDREGNRLGRGGGSYDRALPRAGGLTVAVLYDGEHVEQLPAEAHDVRVRAVVTPSGLLRLR